MIDIAPISFADVRTLLGSDLPPQFAAFNGAVPDIHPQIQLGYEEIEGEEVDRLLGYAGIPKANGPLGLPGEFQSFATPGGWLLFPLEGLADHLRSAAPGVAAAYEQLGSVEAYEELAEAFEAREYLVAGTLEALRFCADHGLALQIRW